MEYFHSNQEEKVSSMTSRFIADLKTLDDSIRFKKKKTKQHSTVCDKKQSGSLSTWREHRNQSIKTT